MSMILLQLVLWGVASTAVALVLARLDRGQRPVPTQRLLLASLVWLPLSGTLWVGWGALTGLNTSFGLGDSPPARALEGGYSMVYPEGLSGMLLREAQTEARSLVSHIQWIAESPTHFYGWIGDGFALAFAVHKETGAVERASDPDELRGGPFDLDALQPFSSFPGRVPRKWDAAALCAVYLGPLVLAGLWLRRRRS